MTDLRDKIRQNAKLVIEQMRQICGFDFGYDTKSVIWLDGYIERQRSREDIDQDFIDSLVNVFGSYLGECVVVSYGGEWTQEDGTWTVRFDAKNAVFPFNKVRKQFDNGSEDSISSFFTTIPLIFKEVLKLQDVAKKPKWKLW